MLGAWGMHLDFAPDIAGGALFPYLEGMAGQAFGMVLGQGGADTIVRALVAAIEARGGAVECGADGGADPARRRPRHGGRAWPTAGTIDGRQRGDRQRRAGGAARLTGGSGDAEFDAGLARFVHAPGTMMIHLATDALPDWTAGAELQRFAYVHIAPSLDAMARTYQQARRRAVAGRAGDRRRPADRGRPQPRARRQAYARGCRCAWRRARILGDAAGDDRRHATGPMAAEPFADRALDIRRAPRARHCAARSLAAASSPPDDVGGRQPQPRRRRSDLRQPSSDAELPVPPAARPCRRHARRSRSLLPDRCRGLARRRNRGRSGLSARPASWPDT